LHYLLPLKHMIDHEWLLEDWGNIEIWEDPFHERTIVGQNKKNKQPVA
jgi:hypothetical protein